MEIRGALLDYNAHKNIVKVSFRMCRSISLFSEADLD